MQNEVWNEIGTFLNGLRCGNVNRETYIQFPELSDAEKRKKAMERTSQKVLDTMEAGQREKVENYIEALKHLAFMAEEQAYCQGYVDCIQLLSGLGMLKGSPNISELINKIKK